jgi:hypothetical protein
MLMQSCNGNTGQPDRAVRVLFRAVARVRFQFARKVPQCLGMLAELEAALGGEREAAAVIGPSIITLLGGVIGGEAGEYEARHGGREARKQPKPLK